MTEVWKENYIAVSRKDEIERLEKSGEGRHTRELGIYKTNYIVVGPLKTSLHISTGWSLCVLH